MRGEWPEFSIGAGCVGKDRPIEIRLRGETGGGESESFADDGELDSLGLSSSGLLPDRGMSGAVRIGLELNAGMNFLTSVLTLNGFSRGTELTCHLGGLKYSSKRTLIAVR